MLGDDELRVVGERTEGARDLAHLLGRHVLAQLAEVLDVEDLGQLGRDVATEQMQKVASTFRSLADNPQFIVTEQL